MPLDIDTLKKYKTDYFIETGTHGGGSVRMALGLGIKNIRSIEVDRDMFEKVGKQLGEHENIKLYHGSSGEELYEMIKDIGGQMTFFLDAHSPITQEDRDKYTLNPILKELELIAKHPIKNHYIIIDDIDIFGQPVYEYVTKEQITNALKEINPFYRFSIQGLGDKLYIAEV